MNPPAAPAPSADRAVEALALPWLRLDAAGRIAECNAALVQLLRARIDAVRGTALDQWLSRASLVMYQSVLEPLLRLHGQVSELALTLHAADGGAVDVLLYAVRSPDADGSVLVQLAPIRQRRRIEAELLRVKRAADQAPGMVFQLERVDSGEWRFPYVSESVRALYGCSAEAAARSADVVFGRVTEGDRPALLAELERCADGGGSFRVLVRVAPPAGAGETPALRWHEFQGTARFRGDGLRLWHGYAKDVSDRVALQESVSQMQAIERLGRLRSEFLGRVSHELRTPLNAILGFAELMETDTDSPPPPEHRQWLEIIHSSGQHLLGIVDQLLDLSRMDSGRLDLQTCSLDPLDCIRQTLPVVAGMAAERGVSLTEPQVQPGLRVEADVQRLRQVLINLLSNAVKYNRRGGQVTVRVDGAGDEVRIEIADTGIGMTEAQRAALFQPFNRLGAENLAIEGSGLGLVVSRHLVEAMRGRLEVRSEPGQGSAFTICLPASRAAVTDPRSGT